MRDIRRQREAPIVIIDPFRSVQRSGWYLVCELLDGIVTVALEH
jgi:hypothetical protein